MYSKPCIHVTSHLINSSLLCVKHGIEIEHKCLKMNEISFLYPIPTNHSCMSAVNQGKLEGQAMRHWVKWKGKISWKFSNFASNHIILTWKLSLPTQAKHKKTRATATATYNILLNHLTQFQYPKWHSLHCTELTLLFFLLFLYCLCSSHLHFHSVIYTHDFKRKKARLVKNRKQY